MRKSGLFSYILAYLFFPFVLILWLITSIIAFLSYFIIFTFFKGDKAYKATFYVTKLWGGSLFMGFFCPIKSIGREYLDPNESYVLVSNHSSVMDIPACMWSCPVPFSFLAKSETLKIPVVGYLVRNAHVPVNRKNAASRRKSMEDMIAHLKKGRSIHIYPEGTRNTTDKPLKDFYDGAFRLAIAAQKPISVLTLIGTENVSNPRDRYFCIHPFRSVKAVWSEPISTIGMTEKDVVALKETVEKRLVDTFAAYRK